MFYDLSPQKTSQLKLMARVALGKASNSDREELDKLIQADSSLSAEFQSLEQEILGDKESHLHKLCLRILFNTASPEDVEELSKMRKESSNKKEESERLFFILRVMAESASMAPTSGEATSMPPEIRSRLLARLKEPKLSNWKAKKSEP